MYLPTHLASHLSSHLAACLASHLAAYLPLHLAARFPCQLLSLFSYDSYFTPSRHDAQSSYLYSKPLKLLAYLVPHRPPLSLV